MKFKSGLGENLCLGFFFAKKNYPGQYRVPIGLIVGILALFSLFSAPLQGQGILLTKSVNNANPEPGEAFTFVINYRCTGLTGNCPDAQIVDNLPAALEILSYSGTGGLVENVSVSGSTITWTLGNGSGGELPAGSVGTVFITARFPGCGSGISDGTTLTNTATMTATLSSPPAGQGSPQTDDATVTQNGDAPACPSPPPATVNTDFRKISLRDEGVIDGPLQRWTIRMPTKAETGSGDQTYTVTDIFPNNMVVVDIAGITEWTNNGSTRVGDLEVQCGNSGNWYPLVSTSTTDELEYDENSGATSHYTNVLPSAALQECLGIDNPDINRINGPGGGGYLNITGIRFTVDESQYPNTGYQPELTVSYFLLSQNPFAGLTVPAGSPARPLWQAPVPGNITQNCVSSNIDMDDAAGVQTEVCDIIEIFAPGTGALNPTKNLNGTLGNPGGGTFPSTADLIDPNASPPRLVYENTIGWRFNVRKTHASGRIEGIKVFELLDPNVEFDPSVDWFIVQQNNGGAINYTNGILPITQQPDCGDPDLTVIPNYRGTGRTALIFDFKSCYFPPTTNSQNGSGNRDRIDILLTARVKPGYAGTVEDAFIVIYDNQGTEQIINGCENTDNGLDNFFDESDQSALGYMYDGQSDLFSPAWTNADRSYIDLLDLTDLDNNGLTADEFLCVSTVNADWDIPTIADMTSEKLVNGKLDAVGQYTKYPAIGNTDLTGDGTYRLTLRNTGNVNITTFDVVDVLPYVGDQGVLPTNGARLSQWAEELSGAITIEVSTDNGATWNAVPGGELPLNIQYSTSTNPERFENDPASNFKSLTADQAVADHMITTGGPYTQNPWGAAAAGARSFSFRYTPTSPFEPNYLMRITAPIRIATGTCPPGQSGSPCAGTVDENAVAWNSFAFAATYDDGGSGARLLDSEPIKVGLKMIDPAATASLGNFVWHDLNANGVQDGGEPGFEGVTVSLFATYNIDNGLIDVNGDGNYDANDDGYIDGRNIIDGQVDVDNNGLINADDDRDAGTDIFGGYRIVDGGVSVDGDGNGFETNGQDDGTFTGKLNSTVTNASGQYTFIGLRPNSNYIVRLDNDVDFGSGGVLEGYGLTTQDAGAATDATDSDAALNGNGEPEIGTATTGAASSNTNTYDFGLFQSNTVGDLAWYDLNGLGYQPPVPAPVEGVSVALWSVGTNGTAENGVGDDVQIGSTLTTDANGNYLFTGVPNGDYYLIFDKSNITGTDPNTGQTVDPNDWVFAPQDFSGNDVNDSDPDPTNGVTATFTLNGGETDLDWDVGLQPAPKILGTIWADLDQDGVYDAASEPVLEGITIRLLDNGGTFITSETTDANGDYEFSGLNISTTYQVEIVLPSGATLTTQDAGTNDTRDSDFDTGTNRIGPITTGTAFPDLIFPDNDGGLILDIDLGDLPDGSNGTGAGDYQTLLANNGPAHIIDNSLILSTNIDAENDGQPDAQAGIGASGGDDNTGTPDDEDGVTIPAIQSKDATATFPVTLTNNTGSNARLYAFVDWNNDGDFADANEQQLTSGISSSASPQNLDVVFTLPTSGLVTDTDLGVRFRLTTENLSQRVSTSGETWEGPALDGEVEDYVVNVSGCPTINSVTFSASPVCEGGDFTVTVAHDANIGEMEIIYDPSSTLSEAQVYASTNVLATINGTTSPTTSGSVSIPNSGTYTLYARLTTGNSSYDVNSCTPIVGSTAQITVNALPAANDVTLELCDDDTDGSVAFDLRESFDATGTDLDDGATNTAVTFYSDATRTTMIPYGLVITGVIDGPRSGGTPKAIELYALCDIPDLSVYGVGSANNGNGGGSEEFTFPSGSASAGDYIYVANEATEFSNFFGFLPDYTSGAASINGDDAIELFHNGVVIDVFGDPNVGGTGEPWEYLDGWAYRQDDINPNLGNFVATNWTYSTPNALDGEPTNAGATTPMPVGTYTNAATTACAFPADNSTTVYALVTNADGCSQEATITFDVLTCVDYGDLPNDGAGAGTDYAVVQADNGPSHIIDPDLRIGAIIDDEADGAPDANAQGDDNAAGTNIINGSADDEDGIDLNGIVFKPGQTVSIPAVVTNETGMDTYLRAFIDWNNDGDFNDPMEISTVTIADAMGSQTVLINFTLPADANPGDIVGARFRLSSDNALGPNGPATKGEVEDYVLTIGCPTGNCYDAVINTSNTQN